MRTYAKKENITKSMDIRRIMSIDRQLIQYI